MVFDERAAIQLRMQQIFQERERLQDEYKELFSRLREIDQLEGTQVPATPLEIEKPKSKSTQAGAHNNPSQWENIELDDKIEEEVDTKDFDKRIDQLQEFLETET
ncbi:hypothetical protein [Alkalihalobacillus deserti]|uniref:hypothetical protein n=1 Tax=Alkalihalobacillus deserti TaxID=2879466 RepID=UPI001D141F65|nr:hypothetical protein [Alkalihalobacillus deserti]